VVAQTSASTPMLTYTVPIPTKPAIPDVLTVPQTAAPPTGIETSAAVTSSSVTASSSIPMSEEVVLEKALQAHEKAMLRIFDECRNRMLKELQDFKNFMKTKTK
jgi:hypothetical protein